MVCIAVFSCCFLTPKVLHLTHSVQDILDEHGQEEYAGMIEQVCQLWLKQKWGVLGSYNIWPQWIHTFMLVYSINNQASFEKSTPKHRPALVKQTNFCSTHHSYGKLRSHQAI